MERLRGVEIRRERLLDMKKEDRRLNYKL